MGIKHLMSLTAAAVAIGIACSSQGVTEISEPTEEALMARAAEWADAFENEKWLDIYRLSSPTFRETCPGTTYAASIGVAMAFLRGLLGIEESDTLELRVSNATVKGTRGNVDGEVLYNGEPISHGDDDDPDRWVFEEGNWWYVPDACDSGLADEGNDNLSEVETSRDDPVPIGKVANLNGNWEVRVVTTVPDATEAILAENQFKDPPEPEHQYFMVTVEAAYQGLESDEFDGSFRLRAVGASSVAYSTFENSCGVIPNQLPDPELFPGGTIEGNVCWDILSSDASSLVMYDDPFESSGRTWFALQPGT